MRVNSVSNVSNRISLQSNQNFGSAHLHKAVEYVTIPIDNEGHTALARVVTIRLKELMGKVQELLKGGANNEDPAIVLRRIVIPETRVEGNTEHGFYSYLTPKRVYGGFKLKDGGEVSYQSPNPEHTHVQVKKANGEIQNMTLCGGRQGLTSKRAERLIKIMKKFIVG